MGSAHAAFQGWSSRPAVERGALLRRLSAELLGATEHIADVIVAEQGKPRAQAAFEVRLATEWLDWYAEEARRTYGEIVPPSVPGKRLLVLRQPVGVVLAITPWNFPLYMIVRKLAPGLASGCTMVVKPAEQTPLAAAELVRRHRSGRVPARRRQPGQRLEPGNARPAALIADERVRKISFTGSTEVGKILVRASAERLARVSLELGGHTPFIVFDDADLDAAVAGLLTAKFQVCGQSCICPNRIFVQDGVVDEFQDRLVAAVAPLKVGPGTDPDVNIGPLIDEQGFEKVQRHVTAATAAGATLVHGGARLHGDPYDLGHFYPPTILADVTDEMVVAREETFGPVVPLLSFGDVEEVVARANHSDYGLAAYMYTKDLRPGAARLRSVWSTASSASTTHAGHVDGALRWLQAVRVGTRGWPRGHRGLPREQARVDPGIAAAPPGSRRSGPPGPPGGAELGTEIPGCREFLHPDGAVGRIAPRCCRRDGQTGGMDLRGWSPASTPRWRPGSSSRWCRSCRSSGGRIRAGPAARRSPS